MPALKLAKQTTWQTTDGSHFTSQVEAIEHEKRLVLASIINPGEFGIPPRAAAAIVKKLLRSPSITIVLNRS